MPTTIPALRGTFGETEYFLTTMAIGELTRNVQFPTELADWEHLSIEERYQREINLRRVRSEIAPYFANDPDRFSGALVLAVKNAEKMEFESLGNFGGGGRNPVPQLYQSAARNMGFLTLDGGEVLIPLDGQHRAKAFKFAIDGADDNNRPIASIKSNQDLAKDQVAVILLRFEPQRARHIFSKINRYARPTVRGDNLITDDDDAIAVITRELLGEDGVIPSRLVRLGGNTLPANALEFTTLSTFYDSNEALINGLGFVGRGSAKQMPADQRELAKEEIRRVWERLLSQVDLWAKSIADPAETGDDTRITIRKEMLLGKPVAQLSLVRAYLIMRERCQGVADNVLCDRLNQIDWGVENPMWHGVLMHPNGRVMSGRGAVNRACQFIAHLGGVKLTDEEANALLEHIHGAEWEQQELPAPVA